MARKKSGSFALILYAVGGYLLYENWPAVSAWFGSMVAATPAPAAAVPASAGTVVSTAAPASAAPASAAPVTSSGGLQVQPTPGTLVPASAGTVVPTGADVLMKPGGFFLMRETLPQPQAASVPQTAAQSTN